MTEDKKGTRTLTFCHSTLLKSKCSQITIFVLVAILLAVAIILLFMLLKQPITKILGGESKEPNQEIEQCIKKNIEKASDLLIENGGYIKPPLTKSVGYNLGERNEIPYKNYTYLCYTSALRLKCVAQNPSIIEHLRSEIEKYMQSKIQDCFNGIKYDLEKSGYIVTLGNNMDFSVELVSRAIVININRKIGMEKSDQTKKFEHFVARTTSPIYNFGLLSQEIIRQESLYCNSEYIELMRDNQRFEITKFQTGDDNKLYSIKDEISEKIFRFLIRGCVLPTPS